MGWLVDGGVRNSSQLHSNHEKLFMKRHNAKVDSNNSLAFNGKQRAKVYASVSSSGYAEPPKFAHRHGVDLGNTNFQNQTRPLINLMQQRNLGYVSGSVPFDLKNERKERGDRVSNTLSTDKVDRYNSEVDSNNSLAFNGKQRAKVYASVSSSGYAEPPKFAHRHGVDLGSKTSHNQARRLINLTLPRSLGYVSGSVPFELKKEQRERGIVKPRTSACAIQITPCKSRAKRTQGGNLHKTKDINQHLDLCCDPSFLTSPLCSSHSTASHSVVDDFLNTHSLRLSSNSAWKDTRSSELSGEFDPTEVVVRELVARFHAAKGARIWEGIRNTGQQTQPQPQNHAKRKDKKGKPKKRKKVRKKKKASQ